MRDDIYMGHVIEGSKYDQKWSQQNYIKQESKIYATLYKEKDSTILVESLNQFL